MSTTFQVGPLVFSTFGSWCAMSLLVVARVGRDEFRRRLIPVKHLGYFVIVVAPLAAVGASYAHALDVGGWSVLKYWLYAPAVYPGASFLGGALFSWVTALAYARVVLRPSHQVGVFLDALAPLILLMYGLGRVGCHLAGHGTCCGAVTDAWYGVHYPHGAGTEGSVVPMALVEAGLTLVLFAWLWTKRTRALPGVVFGWHLVLLGTERLCVEPWRINPRHALGLTQAQWIAGVLVVVGAAWIRWASGDRARLNCSNGPRAILHRRDAP